MNNATVAAADETILATFELLITLGQHVSLAEMPEEATNLAEALSVFIDTNGSRLLLLARIGHTVLDR